MFVCIMFTVIEEHQAGILLQVLQSWTTLGISVLEAGLLMDEGKYTKTQST